MAPQRTRAWADSCGQPITVRSFRWARHSSAPPQCSGISASSSCLLASGGVSRVSEVRTECRGCEGSIDRFRALAGRLLQGTPKCIDRLTRLSKPKS